MVFLRCLHGTLLAVALLVAAPVLVEAKAKSKAKPPKKDFRVTERSPEEALAALEAVKASDGKPKSRVCSACQMIAKQMDGLVDKTRSWHVKKAHKYLSKHLKASNFCTQERFGPQVGVVVKDYPGARDEIVEDAVAYARGIGIGNAVSKSDPAELGQVARGTHKEVFVHPLTREYMLALCPYWVGPNLNGLLDNLHSILEDGGDVSEALCYHTLDLCPCDHCEKEEAEDGVDEL